MKSLLRNTAKALLNTVVVRGGFLWRLPPDQSHAICITFDDGPNSTYTMPILELLHRHGVKATFFLVGENAEKYPYLVREIVRQGHTVGGHTSSHKEITQMRADELTADLQKTRRIIGAASGIDTVLFRPPRGVVDYSSLVRVKVLGYRTVHWTKTYSDYRKDGESRLLGRMRANPPKQRDIILLHDDNAFTLSALEQIIPEWKAQGLGFSPVEYQRPMSVGI